VFALSAVPVRDAAESENLRVAGHLNFSDSAGANQSPVLAAATIRIVRISEFSALHLARDWTHAPTWLQCVARFSKDHLNE
jgi:hypothetical protein